MIPERIIFISHGITVIPRRLNFICRRFRTLCLLHLHRQCKQKYNQDEIVGVFVWEKVWLENSLSQWEGGGDVVGAGPSRETGCGGQRPQVEVNNLIPVILPAYSSYKTSAYTIQTLGNQPKKKAYDMQNMAKV